MMTTWEELKQRGMGHYKTGQIEPIDLYRSSGMLRHFALGNIIKYAFRNANPENPLSIKDMEKIKHYAEMMIVEHEGTVKIDNPPKLGGNKSEK
jgi:hypothetical protein